MYCLIHQSANHFFWDEWNVLVRFSEYVLDGNPEAWNLLWEPHFGHRLVLLRMLSAINFVLFSRSQFPLQLLSWLTQVALLAVLTRRLAGIAGCSSPLAMISAFSLSALLFSPSMMLAWLWPMCLQQVWTSFFFVLAMMQVMRVRNGVKPHKLVIYSVLCTLSSGNGIVVWPAAILLAACISVSRRTLTLLVMIGVVVLSIYFNGLAMDSVGSQEHSLVQRLLYVMAFVGSPLSGKHFATAVFAGGVGLAVFAVMAVAAIRRSDKETLVDLSFAGITLASAIAGAVFRSGLGGAEQAMMDRYIPLALPMWIGVLLASVRGVARCGRWYAWVRGTVVAAIMAAFLSPVIASRPLVAVPFAGAKYDYVRLAEAALQDGVVVTSGVNPYVNLYLAPADMVRAIGRFRQHDRMRFSRRNAEAGLLGSSMDDAGVACQNCAAAGRIASVDPPFGDIDLCGTGFKIGAFVQGELHVASRDIEAIILVDERDVVVGQGIITGGFPNGVDPSELIYWRPRNWIGFVSGEHSAQRTGEVPVRAFARRKRDRLLLPLSGSVSTEVAAVQCD